MSVTAPAEFVSIDASYLADCSRAVRMFEKVVILRHRPSGTYSLHALMEDGRSIRRIGSRLNRPNHDIGLGRWPDREAMIRLAA